MISRRGLGHTGATPVGLACPTFLVPTSGAQALVFLGWNEKSRPSCDDRLFGILVPRRGLEPPHPKAHGPEPCASTNSATWALTAEFVFQPTPARQKITIARFLNDANYFCIFSYPTEINAALALHKNRFYAYCYIKSWGNPCQPVYPHKVDSRYGHLAINGIIKTRTRCQRVFLCLAPTGQRVF